MPFVAGGSGSITRPMPLARGWYARFARIGIVDAEPALF
jgi:hypothetical protein